MAITTTAVVLVTSKDSHYNITGPSSNTITKGWKW